MKPVRLKQSPPYAGKIIHETPVLFHTIVGEMGRSVINGRMVSFIRG